jgi:hypothetical protein
MSKIRMIVFEWTVYGPDTGAHEVPPIGKVLTQVCDLNIAKQTALRLYPNAVSVWLVGGSLGGHI